MKLNEKSNIIASVGTVLFLVLLFLLLWFFYIRIPQPEEDEGILVTFEQPEVEEEPLPVVPELAAASASAPSMVEATNPEATTPKPAPQPILTQEDEAAIQADRAEQERQRKENEAIAKAQQMASLFGSSTSEDLSTGAGGKGTSNASNPLSKGSSDGNDWSLNGRYLIGSLPKPAAEFTQEGKVVVFITVNKEGYVVSARAGQGTTISDEATRQLAVKAALKAQFNMVDHPNAVMGTITYYFKFK